MIRELIAATACLVVPPQEREMNTAAMAIQHGYVMDVADHKVKAIKGQFQRFRVEKIWSRLTSGIISAVAVRALTRASMRFEEDALFFKGIDKEMQEHTPDVSEWADKILPRLETIKIALLDGRKSMMLMFASSGVDPAVLTAKERVIFSMADLFESIEQFKWTVKELQADVSPVTEGFAANTPEELNSLFDRMSQEG